MRSRKAIRQWARGGVLATPPLRRRTAGCECELDWIIAAFAAGARHMAAAVSVAWQCGAISPGSAELTGICKAIGEQDSANTRSLPSRPCAITSTRPTRCSCTTTIRTRNGLAALVAFTCLGLPAWTRLTAATWDAGLRQV